MNTLFEWERKYKLSKVLIQVFLIGMIQVLGIMDSWACQILWCSGEGDSLYAGFNYSGSNSSGWMSSIVNYQATDLNGGLAPANQHVRYGTNCPDLYWPIQYTWDFGDGGSGSGSQVSHTYHTSGSFNVQLTVHGSFTPDQSITRTVQVDILPPDTPQPTCSTHTVGEVVDNHIITIHVDPVYDQGGSGVKGYYYAFNEQYDYQFNSGGTYISQYDLQNTQGTINSGYLADGYNWYFHIMAVDNAGNKSYAISGPYYIRSTSLPSNDTTLPDFKLLIECVGDRAAFTGRTWGLQMTCEGLPEGWIIDRTHWNTYGIDSDRSTDDPNAYKLTIPVTVDAVHKTVPIQAGVHLYKKDSTGNIIAQGWHNTFISYNSLDKLSTNLSENTYKIYFILNNTNDKNGYTDTTNRIPNWYFHWRDGAVPDMGNFSFTKTDIYGGCIHSNDTNSQGDLFWIGKMASTEHYPELENIPINGIIFGGASGIDCCEEVCKHEMKHSWIWHQINDPEGAWKGKEDKDRDGLADDFELTLGLSTSSKDTFNLIEKRGIYGETASGDEEYVVMLYAHGAKGIVSMDWAYWGKQSNPSH